MSALRVCLLSAVLLTIAGCGGHTASTGPRGNPTSGAHLFVVKRCISCHTVNGVGGEVGPNLTDYPPATGYDSLKGILQNPPPQMASGIAGERFTDREVRDLNAFFASSLKPKG